MEIQRPKSRQPIPSHAKRVFKGEIFDVYQWEQKLYDGTKAIFERARRPDSVIVFPVLEDGQILLIEQEQPGAPSFIGAPGGRVDKDEGALDAAKRELLEETGYEASEFILWDAQQPVGKIDWAVYSFIAKGLKQAADMHPDAGEKITLKPVGFDEFLDYATNARFAAREVAIKLCEARFSPEKRTELKKLFTPI